METAEYTCTVRLKVGAPGSDASTAFGKGTAQLLRGVELCGSLNQAARQLGMAYSKAWTGIGNTERQLGFALIERHGQHGSVLTQRGREFLELYEKAAAAAEEAASRVLSGK